MRCWNVVIILLQFAFVTKMEGEKTTTVKGNSLNTLAYLIPIITHRLFFLLNTVYRTIIFLCKKPNQHNQQQEIYGETVKMNKSSAPRQKSSTSPPTNPILLTV